MTATHWAAHKSKKYGQIGWKGQLGTSIIFQGLNQVLIISPAETTTQTTKCGPATH